MRCAAGVWGSAKSMLCMFAMGTKKSASTVGRQCTKVGVSEGRHMFANPRVQ